MMGTTVFTSQRSKSRDLTGCMSLRLGVSIVAEYDLGLQADRDFLEACETFVREYNHRGRIALARGDVAGAKKNLLEAQKLVEGDLAGHRALTALTYNNMGCLLRRSGQADKALCVLEKARALLPGIPEAAVFSERGPAGAGGASNEDDIDVADVHLNISSVLSQLQRHDDALIHAETAISILSTRFGCSTDLSSLERDCAGPPPSPGPAAKDVRLLTIALYNCAAEQQVLGMAAEAAENFSRAVLLCHAHLCTGDPLVSSIQAAHVKALDAAARARSASLLHTHRNITTTTNVAPGVTPLRLSMLHQPTCNSLLQSGKLSSSVAGFLHEERPSQRSTSSVASAPYSTPRSAMLQLLTPQGWHTLHPVKVGSRATASRKSERGERDAWGLAEVMREERRVPEHFDDGAALVTPLTVIFADGSAQTTLAEHSLGPHAPSGSGAASLDGHHLRRSRRVFVSQVGQGGAADEMGHTVTATAECRGAQDGAVDRTADSPSGILAATAPGVLSIIRSAGQAPAWHIGVMDAAERYLTGTNSGIFGYERKLADAVAARREAGTQVEEVECEGGRAEQYMSVEELICEEAMEVRRASARLGPGAWVEGPEGDWAHRLRGSSTLPVSQRSESVKRTYRDHLQRTRDAHERYNAVATLVQRAYRCHCARVRAVRMQRNPSHLRLLYVNQIYAFATLLQCNVRTMLARLCVGHLAGRKAVIARQEWLMCRINAARRIQAFLLLKCGVRRHHVTWRVATQTRAAATIQRALRLQAGRAEQRWRRKAKRWEIEARVQDLAGHSALVIQGNLRAWSARRHAAVKRLSYALRPEDVPHTEFWALGAAKLLTGPQMHEARRLQDRAAVSLQVLYARLQASRTCRGEGVRNRAARRIRSVATLQRAARQFLARRRFNTAVGWRHGVALRAIEREAAALIQRSLLSHMARVRMCAQHACVTQEVSWHSATQIQSVVRGSQARYRVRCRMLSVQREIHEWVLKSSNSCRVQCAVRCWRAKQVAIEAWRRKTVLAAAITLQSAMRVFMARNGFKLQALLVHQRRFSAAALAIQSWTLSNPAARARAAACFWVRRRADAVTRLATAWRAWLAREEVRHAVWERRWQDEALAIQRVLRGHLGRGDAALAWDEATLRMRERVSRRLQMALRGFKARRLVRRQRLVVDHQQQVRVQLQRQCMHEAVADLQRCARSLLSRVLVTVPVLAARDAAARRCLGQAIKDRLLRQEARRQITTAAMRRAEAKARLMQRVYRQHVARKVLRFMVAMVQQLPVLQARERELVAACMLQHAYIARLARRTVRERAEDLVVAIVRRGVACHVYRRCLFACRLQAAARARLYRDALRRALAGSHIAASVRAMLVHKAVVRRFAGEMLSAAALAALIRAAYSTKVSAKVLAGAALRTLNGAAHAEALASHTLAGAARRALEKRKMTEWRTQALLVQSLVRGHLDRAWFHECRTALLERKGTIVCVIRLQAAQRGHVARSLAAEMRALAWATTATRTVQAVLQRAPARAAHRARMEDILANERVLRLQCFLRGALAAHALERRALKKKELRAVSILQPLARGHAGRERFRAERLRQAQVRCALLLQAHARGAIGRIYLLRLQLAAQLDSAATAILAGARGMRDRTRARHAREMRRRALAAAVIQATGRGMAGRLCARGMRDELRRVQAAVLIQTLARGVAGRALAAWRWKQIRMGHAAVKIQSLVRGVAGRTRVQRRLAARVAMEEFRHEMVVRIQRNARMKIARQTAMATEETRAAEEFERDWFSRCLQRVARSFLARRCIERRRSAALVLTSFARQVAACKRCRRRRAIVSKDALYQFPHILRPDAYAVPLGTDLSCPARRTTAWHRRILRTGPPTTAVMRALSEAARVVGGEGERKIFDGQGKDSPLEMARKQSLLAKEAFQEAPQVRAFFYDLQAREHSHDGARRPARGTRPVESVASAREAARPGVTGAALNLEHLAAVGGASPSAVPQPREVCEAPVRGTGRLPPRFAKQRAVKGGAGPKLRSDKPRRKSHTNLESDMNTSNDKDVPSTGRPDQRQLSYNKEDISSDPSSSAWLGAERQQLPPTVPKPRLRSHHNELLGAQGAAVSSVREAAIAQELHPKIWPAPSANKPPLPRPPGAAPVVTTPVENRGASSADPRAVLIEAAARYCKMGKYREVEKLVEELDPARRVPVDASFGQKGDPLLLICAMHGQKRIAKLLLRKFADINAVFTYLPCPRPCLDPKRGSDLRPDHELQVILVPRRVLVQLYCCTLPQLEVRSSHL